MSTMGQTPQVDIYLYWTYSGNSARKVKAQEEKAFMLHNAYIGL
jgi:hypothetical protein